MKNYILFTEVLSDSELSRIALDLEVRIAKRITDLLDSYEISTCLHISHEIKAIKKMKGQVVCIRKYLAKPDHF